MRCPVLTMVAARAFVAFVTTTLVLPTNVSAAEVDQFLTGRANVTLTTASGSESVMLTGPITIQVDLGSLADRNGNGLEEVSSEIVQLNLVGTSTTFGPIALKLRDPGQRPFRRSMGQIEETGNDIPGLLEIPPFVAVGAATSFFDLFVEFERSGQTLHNETPVRIEAVITSEPPAKGDVYISTADVIPLLDEGGNRSNVAFLSAKLALDPLLGDINLDGKVNIDDVNIIFAARNTPASLNDPRDLNGNNTIEVNDARLCALFVSCFNKGTQVLRGPQQETGEGCTRQEAIQNARKLIGNACTGITCEGKCNEGQVCAKIVDERVGITTNCQQIRRSCGQSNIGFSCTVSAPNNQSSFDCVCRCLSP